jgi:protein TonB
MSHRKILVGASIAGHVALFTGVFLAGAWKLDRVDYEYRARTALAVMNPPPPEGGSYTPTPPKVDLKQKQKTPVKEPRQPRPPRPEPEIPPSPGPSEPGEGLGLGTGPGTGPGDGDGPPGADPCKEAGAACPPPPAPPLPEVPRPPPRVHTVLPQILKGLRTSGETAIHPPYAVLQQMHRNEDRKTIASIKVCLAADGTVSSVALLTSTKYAAYDEAIMGAARRWRYKPYTVNGAPVPACGMVTFVYRLN